MHPKEAVDMCHLSITNSYEYLLLTDLEERVAQELAVIYPRHCWSKQNQRVNVPEQHGDPQTALRRSF